MRERHRLSLGDRVRRRAAGPLGRVLSGAVIGQCAQVISTPLLGRLYGLGALGVFGLLVGYSQIAAILITLRLEQALPRLPEHRRWLVLRAALLVSLVGSLPSGAIMAVLAGKTDGATVVSSIALAFATTVTSVANMAALAVGDFRAAGRMSGLNGAVTAIAQVTAGLLAPSLPIMVATFSVGNFAALVPGLRVFREIRGCRGTETLRAIWRAERLTAFVRNIGSDNLLSNLEPTIVLVGLRAVYGEGAAGAFYTARRVLLGPTRLFAQAFGDTSYSIGSSRGVDAVGRMTRRWIRKLVIPAVLVIAAGAVFAVLLPPVMGEPIGVLGIFLLLMGPVAASRMYAMATRNMLIPMGRERLRGRWSVLQLAGLLILFGAIWAADGTFIPGVHIIRPLPLVGAVALYAAYSTVTRLLLVAQVWREAGRLRGASVGRGQTTSASGSG